MVQKKVDLIQCSAGWRYVVGTPDRGGAYSDCHEGCWRAPVMCTNNVYPPSLCVSCSRAPQATSNNPWESTRTLVKFDQDIERFSSFMTSYLCHTYSQPSLCTVHARSCYAMHRDRVFTASPSISTNLRRPKLRGASFTDYNSEGHIASKKSNTVATS